MQCCPNDWHLNVLFYVVGLKPFLQTLDFTEVMTSRRLDETLNCDLRGNDAWLEGVEERVLQEFAPQDQEAQEVQHYQEEVVNTWSAHQDQGDQ